ncbi:Zinc finger AN1 and C2H2 domain-containing stress-associated protein 13 [Sesamum alatum]|uniref:Zinc finger AN1 and C2H2 domain-containing stress-associated protein 13 n=1 Tax=Sesamum alatum TaxID=300844 RepID=A0AAE2CRR1_9LAMI|nr:Zinc finger AN1 and C2H2 domain-containing stress-associated protein 13 [Sesamum alatum]
MGTPAIPNLGKHCSVDDCRQIDFLPFSCDCCRQIYCLEHRSYSRHQCAKANECDVTVVICPLCAKGVRLIPEEDANITWESHVDIECDPSNYDKVTKKRACPVPGCRGILTFSNTTKCRDCSVDHCLKHRFGPDHNCAGPKKSEAAYQFMGFLNRSRKEELNQAPGASSSRWATTIFKAASSVRATAEAGMARLSVEFNQALGRDGAVQSSIVSHTGNATGQVEVCPQCNLQFSTVGALVDHVEKVHDRNGVINAAPDVCPKCSKGFRDPVTLVDHVEREHEGLLKA